MSQQRHEHGLDLVQIKNLIDHVLYLKRHQTDVRWPAILKLNVYLAELVVSILLFMENPTNSLHKTVEISRIY